MFKKIQVLSNILATTEVYSALFSSRLTHKSIFTFCVLLRRILKAWRPFEIREKLGFKIRENVKKFSSPLPSENIEIWRKLCNGPFWFNIFWKLLKYDFMSILFKDFICKISKSPLGSYLEKVSSIIFWINLNDFIQNP